MTCIRKRPSDSAIVWGGCRLMLGILWGGANLPFCILTKKMIFCKINCVIFATFKNNSYICIVIIKQTNRGGGNTNNSAKDYDYCKNRNTG